MMKRTLATLFLSFSLFSNLSTAELTLNKGDHITYIGNNLADRKQHFGWLETMIQSRFPDHELVFRNLGFTADEIKKRPRSANFGSPEDWLKKTETDVVFAFFGYAEIFSSNPGDFKKDLHDLVKKTLETTFDGQDKARIILFSPIAHENLNSPHVPDGSANNEKLAAFTEAMAAVAKELNVPYVDLYNPTKSLYASSQEPLTLNGIHLNELGNEEVARIIDEALFGSRPKVKADLKKLREAILDKNYHWFNHYRTVDGYNVYGGRSRLSWHNQSNADVMAVEMECFKIMTANRDRRIWAVARGGDLEVKDDNLPDLLEVQPNRNNLKNYLGGKEAIEKMEIPEEMEVNLFASEEMFPEFISPVQMAVDTDSRLWAVTWPTYPHWNPKTPREKADRIVILPDEDGDGVADKMITFAKGLNSVTGLEFWGGGVLVAAAPEIWFMKDTDGDDVADVKIRMLQGVSSADTHHTANACVIGPGGWFYWSRGVFHVTNMETPTKIFRSGTSGVYRF
ncbi:MAG: GDSL-type esterase/lipase family protein, partial [Verrucomicrobiota bacterium]